MKIVQLTSTSHHEMEHTMEHSPASSTIHTPDSGSEYDEDIVALPPLPSSFAGSLKKTGPGYVVEVVNKPGKNFMSAVRMEAVVKATPMTVFAILTHPDNSGVFRDIKRTVEQWVVRDGDHNSSQEDTTMDCIATGPGSAKELSQTRLHGRATAGPAAANVANKAVPYASPMPADNMAVAAAVSTAPLPGSTAAVPIASSACKGQYNVLDVTQTTEVKLLWLSRGFSTLLRLEEDSRNPQCLCTRFNLLQPGMVSSMQGGWEMTPLELQPEAAEGKPCSGTKVVLVQEMGLNGVPSFLTHVPLLGRVIRGSLQRTVLRMLEDLQAVVAMVNSGMTVEEAIKEKRRMAGL